MTDAGRADLAPDPGAADLGAADLRAADLAARGERALALVAAAYRHEALEAPPIVIGDVNYWISGEDPGRVPADYFEPGAYASQLAFQEAKIRAHLARYDDAYVPFLFPWYGTVVVPSALGCTIEMPPGEELAVAGPAITEPSGVARLVPPDPERDGLMPRVLACIDHFRAHSDLPVSFTDNQGPLNIALNLVGLERLVIWMAEEPAVVHELMEFCTSVLIDWVRRQKERAGAPIDGGAFPHFTPLPPGIGGVWISDDDSTVLSPRLYREFVVPYNGRVFSAFGGGTLHYCGDGGHQLENFLATDGLVGINAWCMGHFDQLARAQELFGSRITIMVGDYTPLEPEAYFDDLFAVLDPRGVILTTCPSPSTALRFGTGQVEAVRRDAAETGRRAWQVMQRLAHAGRPR
jgi:uroporphyrinogen decarboxylase